MRLIQPVDVLGVREARWTNQSICRIVFFRTLVRCTSLVLIPDPSLATLVRSGASMPTRTVGFSRRSVSIETRKRLFHGTPSEPVGIASPGVSAADFAFSATKVCERSLFIARGSSLPIPLPTLERGKSLHRNSFRSKGIRHIRHAFGHNTYSL